jgi:hypothetical protein
LLTAAKHIVYYHFFHRHSKSLSSIKEKSELETTLCVLLQLYMVSSCKLFCFQQALLTLYMILYIYLGVCLPKKHSFGFLLTTVSIPIWTCFDHELYHVLNGNIHELYSCFAMSIDLYGGHGILGLPNTVKSQKICKYYKHCLPWWFHKIETML